MFTFDYGGNVSSLAHPYLINEDGVYGLNLPDDDSVDFKSMKSSLRIQLKSIQYSTVLPIMEVHKYAADYAFLNLALGMTQQYKASKRRERGSVANDGTNRQHWIPSAYMRSFASKGIDGWSTLRIPQGVRGCDIQEGRFSPSEISLDDQIFRETNEAFGDFYDPKHELALAKFEDDYGDLLRNKNIRETEKYSGPENLWEFITLSTFIILLSIRTKFKREFEHPASGRNAALPFILEILPALVASVDLYCSNLNEILPGVVTPGEIRMPFSEDPVMEWLDNSLDPARDVYFADDEVIVGLPGMSFCCAITPQCIVQLKNKNSDSPAIGSAELSDDELAYTWRLHYHLRSSEDNDVFYKPGTSPELIL